MKINLAKQISKNKALASVLAILFILNFVPLTDKIADNYLDDALAASATAYLAARGINATISVLQDIEFSVGIMSGSPGEMLDPLNDLIERFSSVMLFATASLGIQKVMLEISGWAAFKILILILLTVLAIHYFYSQNCGKFIKQNMNIIYKCLILLLALRFVVPLMAIASSYVENTFIADQMNQGIADIQELNRTTASISKKDDDIQTPETSTNNADKVAAESVSGDDEASEANKSMLSMSFWKDSAGSVIGSISDAASSVNPKNKIETKISELKLQMSNSITSTTNLISLFIIQSVILPVLFLYIFLLGAKGLFRYDFSA